MLLAEEYAPDLTGMRDKFVQTPLGLLLQGEGSAAMDRLGSDAQVRVDQMTSPDTAINAGLDMMGAGLLGTIGKAGQAYTSAATSINKDKLPAVFTKLTKEEKFAPGSRNIDIGGGKFDNASEHLAKQDVENLVFDPYNRSADHNRMVLDSVRTKPADTATVSNVLNVIPDEANQIKTLETAYKSLKDDGEVFITVYEGNKSGVGKVTGADQFQQNKKLSGYLDTVRKVFPNATVKGGMIRATK